MEHPSSQKGIIRAIVMVIIALAILTYFGLDLSKLFTAQGPQQILSALTKFVEWAVSYVIYYWTLLLNYLKSVTH